MEKTGNINKNREPISTSRTKSKQSSKHKKRKGLLEDSGSEDGSDSVEVESDVQVTEPESDDNYENTSDNDAAYHLPNDKGWIMERER